jgi:hypothetical protein
MDTLTYGNMLPNVLANQFGVFLPILLAMTALGGGRGLFNVLLYHVPWFHVYL